MYGSPDQSGTDKTTQQIPIPWKKIIENPKEAPPLEHEERRHIGQAVHVKKLDDRDLPTARFSFHHGGGGHALHGQGEMKSHMAASGVMSWRSARSRRPVVFSSPIA